MEGFDKLGNAISGAINAPTEIKIKKAKEEDIKNKAIANITASMDDKQKEEFMKSIEGKNLNDIKKLDYEQQAKHKYEAFQLEKQKEERRQRESDANIAVKQSVANYANERAQKAHNQNIQIKSSTKVKDAKNKTIISEEKIKQEKNKQKLQKIQSKGGK